MYQQLSLTLQEVLLDADADMTLAKYKPDLEGHSASGTRSQESQPADKDAQPNIAGESST